MKRELILNIKGQNSLNLSQVQETVSMWLQTVPQGEWALQLKKVVNQRSLSQNAILWAWMTAVAKEWADATDDHYTKEQWKEFFTRKFLPVTGPDGETVGGSTSALSKEQMTEFLTNIHVWVSENMHMNLPNAEDRMFNEWYSQYEEM